MWKAGDMADPPGGRLKKHNLTFCRSLLRAHRKPDALPDSASCKFLRSVPAVTSFRCLKMKTAENGPCAPPKLADMGVGAEHDGASLTVSLTEQGKEDACFSFFGKLIVSAARSGASCGQHPAWQMGQWECRVSPQCLHFSLTVHHLPQ